MYPFEKVHESLITLGQDTMEHTLDNYLENDRDKSVVEILSHFLSEDVKNTRSNRYETKLKYAGFPFRKSMDEFDSSFQKSIGRSVMDDLMTLRFMHNREIVVLLAPRRR